MSTVLIVDDEPQVREIIQSSIDDLGCDFLLAENLLEAQKLIDQHQDITFAILDGNVGSGGQLPDTQVLLPKLLAMGTVVIAMSSDPSSNEILIEKGAHHLLGKPFKVAKLQEIIRSVR